MVLIPFVLAMIVVTGWCEREEMQEVWKGARDVCLREVLMTLLNRI